MATTSCGNCGNPAATNPCEDCFEDSEPGGLADDVLAAGISDILESSADEECFEAAGGIRRTTSY